MRKPAARHRSSLSFGFRILGNTKEAFAKFKFCDLALAVTGFGATEPVRAPLSWVRGTRGWEGGNQKRHRRKIRRLCCCRGPVGVREFIDPRAERPRTELSTFGVCGKAMAQITVILADRFDFFLFQDSSCFSATKHDRRADEHEISSSVHIHSNKYVKQGPGVSLSTIQSLRKLLDKRKSMQKDT